MSLLTNKKQQVNKKSILTPPKRIPGNTPFFQNPVLKIRAGPVPKSGYRKHNSKVKLIVALILLSGLLVFGIKYVQESNMLKIQLLNISGLKKYVNPTDFNSMVVSNALDKNIVTFNTKAFEKVLLTNFQGALAIKVTKNYPNTLTIDVLERVPLAIVYKQTIADSYLIDSAGYVLGPVDSELVNLPTIKYEGGELVVGKFINADTLPISREIIAEAELADLKISSISFSPKFTKFYLGADLEVFIGNDKNKKASITVVQSLVKKLGLEGKKLKKIDLRYDNDKVIVLYN